MKLKHKIKIKKINKKMGIVVIYKIKMIKTKLKNLNIIQTQRKKNKKLKNEFILLFYI